MRREASGRGRTVESLRDLAISAMTDALNVYGEGAAAASIDLFNDIMSLEGLSASARVPSGLIAAEEVSRIARYQAGKLISGNVEGFVGQMSSSTSFLTRQCANGAMMSQSGIARYSGGWTYSSARGRAIWSYAANATASGYQIRYARVPQGMETCDFCLMLASRGFVYLTPESAEGWNHTHRGCDCLIIGGVVHKDKDTGELVQDTVLEGYGTDDMLALRSEWSGIDRNDVGARLAAMEAIFGRSEW